MGSVDEPRQEAYNKWMLTVTLWPKKCILSGKQINMMSEAYVYKDNFCEHWVDKDEFIIARLKGEI